LADKLAWGKGRKEDFRQWAKMEINRALDQRSVLEADWRRYLELYRAPQEKGVAHFPFEGASQLVFPLAAMNVDPIWARYVSNIHAPTNLWTLSPLNEKWIHSSKPLQDYLTWLDQHILHMWDVDMRVIQEACKLGTSVYKTSWRFERRRKMGYNQYKQRARLVETINQPVVDHVHIANFLLPSECLSIDPDAQGGAPWVGERHRMRPGPFRTMGKGQEPFLPNFDSAAVDLVAKFEESNVTKHAQKIADLDRVDPSTNATSGKPIEWWEMHCRFDTTGDGVEDDIIVHYHEPTSTILRATYATLPMRPYSAVRYLRGDGFYGIGICEQTEIWQKSISNVLNFNIDKLLLSNAPMLGVREGANVVADEPIFPGKQWHLGDPSKDLVPFFLTAPHNFELPQLISFLQESAKQRTGVTDLQFGSVGAIPSRTPATTIQSLLQEGNTRFDMSIKDLRIGGLSEVGLRVLQLLQQQSLDSVNNPEGSKYLNLANLILGQPEGQYAVQALSIPFEAIELGIGVELTATSGVNNKELQKQSSLALLQLFAQFGPQFIQLAQVAQQAQGSLAGNMALQLLKGGQELMTNVLEQFDVRNPEEILGNVNALMGASSQAGQGQPINPMSSGPTQMGGMMGGM
jgi:hypothetical protein